MLLSAGVLFVALVVRIVVDPSQDATSRTIGLSVGAGLLVLLLIGLAMNRRMFRVAETVAAAQPGVRQAFSVTLVSVPQGQGTCVLTADDSGLCLWRYRRRRLEEGTRFSWDTVVIGRDTIPVGFHVWNVIDLSDDEGFIWLTPACLRPASTAERDSLLRKIEVLQSKFRG